MGEARRKKQARCWHGPEESFGDLVAFMPTKGSIDFLAELNLLVASKALDLTLNPFEVIALIGAVQTANASQSSTYSDDGIVVAVSLALKLQEVFKPFPAVYSVLSQGWDTSFDNPFRSKEGEDPLPIKFGEKAL